MDNIERKGILTSIVRFSLRFRGIIISLAIILIGYGIYSLTRAKYDVFPEFAPPQVVIQTEAPGLSPKQVEQLVTQPIENSINGVTGIKSIRSSSIEGLSVITVIFNNTHNIYLDRQVVSERLSALTGTLPTGVHSPIIAPLTSSTSVVMIIGLHSNKISLMKLRTIADWTVKQSLLAVPGVAKIAVYGGDVKEFQIQITPEKLIKYHLSINDIIKTAQEATGIKGSGYIDTKNQRVILHTEGQSLTAGNIAKTVIFRKDGISITLGDVAKVVTAPANKIGAALINGKPGIAMVISAQYGTNTLDVTNRIVKELADLKPALSAQGIKLNPDLFRAADFIDTALSNITSSLLIGAILVIIVLFLFLFNLRTAAISCLAIPLSLLAAVTVLEKFGISLNTMTLGGLAIAIGEVVDDAVIDVENIIRRLRQNKGLQHPKPMFLVILDASIEVRSAVVYATFAVALVFVPILTMSGIAGKLFSPLGISYILSIMASLLVALTVTPALSFVLLGKYDFNRKEPVLQKWIKEKYHRVILRVENSSKTVMISVALISLVSIAMIPFFSGSFVPELKERHFILHMTALPGTSLNESLRIGKKVDLALLNLPFVKSVDQRVGRAELGDDFLGTHDSEIDLNLIPMNGSEAESAQEKIRNVLKNFAGVSFVLNTVLKERIEETLSGYTAPIVINIFGNDLDMLDKKAEEVSSLLKKTHNAEDVKIQSPQGMPELLIHLNKNAMKKWGINTIDALNAIQTAYEGKVVGQIFNKNRVFNLTVKLEPKIKNSISQVSSLPIKNSDGNYILLGQIAGIYESTGRYVILHEGARRVQTITANVLGGNVNLFFNKIKKEILTNINLPQGFYFSFSGSAVEQSRSSKNLIIYSIISLIGIILLLSVVMKNYQNLILVLINLPFALVGGVLVIFLSGGLFSMGSLIGFVTLFGITLRNSIMLISHYEHLINFEGMTWGLDTAIRGASERLVPILMTALVTGLGLLPLAIGSGSAGREIEGPMALVILGGLASSTALNLLVLPTLSLKFGKFVKKGVDEMF